MAAASGRDGRAPFAGRGIHFSRAEEETSKADAILAIGGPWGAPLWAKTGIGAVRAAAIPQKSTRFTVGTVIFTSSVCRPKNRELRFIRCGEKLPSLKILLNGKKVRIAAKGKCAIGTRNRPPLQGTVELFLAVACVSRSLEQSFLSGTEYRYRLRQRHPSPCV